MHIHWRGTISPHHESSTEPGQRIRTSNCNGHYNHLVTSPWLLVVLTYDPKMYWGRVIDDLEGLRMVVRIHRFLPIRGVMRNAARLPTTDTNSQFPMSVCRVLTAAQIRCSCRRASHTYSNTTNNHLIRGSPQYGQSRAYKMHTKALATVES